MYTKSFKTIKFYLMNCKWNTYTKEKNENVGFNNSNDMSEYFC